ncbi:MAG: fibronectin type III domain-containing protein [Ignavibacteriales bacterium]
MNQYKPAKMETTKLIVYIVLLLFGVIGGQNSAYAAGDVISDDFKTDSHLWDYIGTPFRQYEDGMAGVVFSDGIYEDLGQLWLKKNVKPPYTVSFRYFSGGYNFAFMFNQNRRQSNNRFLDYDTKGYGYGIEFDRTPHKWDPRYSHVALIKDSVENHLASIKYDIKDNQLWHNAKIIIKSESVDVFVDNKKLLSWKGKLDHSYSGVGFASTGHSSHFCAVSDVVITPLDSELEQQLQVPKGIKGQALNKNQVRISWQSVTGAGSYNIYRTKVTTGTKAVIPVGLKISTVDYVEPGTTYYYAVVAVSPGGKVGKWPKSLQITTPKINGKNLNAPKGLNLKALGKGKVQASWKPVAGATAYKIYRCRKGDTYNSQPKWSFSQIIQGCSFIDTNRLAPKTGYYYAVAAINNHWEEGKWSKSRAVTTPASNGKWLSAPKLYEIKTMGSNVVDISWYSVTNAQKYRVYRCTKGDENKLSPQKWTYRVDVEGVTGFIDNQNLDLNNGYYYAIVAVNSYGEEGQWSPSYLVTTKLHLSDNDISYSNRDFIIKQANDLKGLVETGASLSDYLADDKSDLSKCFNILDKVLSAEEILKAANNDGVSAQRRWIDSADIILSTYQGWGLLNENTRKKDLMIFSNQFFRKDLQAAWEQAHKNYIDLYIGHALTRDPEKLAELKRIEEDLYQQLISGY